MTLYLYFSLLIFISLVWIGYFFYRPLKSNDINLEKSNVELAKQKTQELKQDLQQGLIDKNVFNEAYEEITQTLATELKQKNTDVDNKSNVSYLIVVFIFVFLLVVSFGIYQFLSPAQAPRVDKQQAPLSLNESAIQVKQRLKDNPDDAKLWQMLGLVSLELGKIDEATAAYEKAYELTPDNTTLLVEYASALASKQGGSFTGRPTLLVAKALKTDPESLDALYLAGIIAIGEGQLNLAKQTWQRALDIMPKEHPERFVFTNILAELATIQEQKQTTQLSKHSINVKVNIAEDLWSRLDKENYIMVYAKTAQGKQMPIAIEKIRLKDFTGEVILDDSNSLMPMQKLSDAQDVIIVVRISKSGLATKQVDDIEVLSKVLNVKNNPIINIKIK